MRFTKMQGTGNDYIYVNGFEETVPGPEEAARFLSRAHYGIGADGLVIIEHSDVADFAMRIYNRDGSRSEMCGNAARCIGKYVYERGLTDKTDLTLMTDAGLRELHLRVQAGRVYAVQVDMGTPELNPALIPVSLPGEVVLGSRLESGGMSWKIHCVSMGNPHCVIFVNDPDDVDLPVFGPMIEHHPVFPNRTNVEFVHVADREHLRMRVWERGTGGTLACGTGACAALVAGVLTGQCNREATVALPGGELRIVWQFDDNHILMEGPAEFVFDGEIDL